MNYQNSLQRIISYVVSDMEKKSIENLIWRNSFNPYKANRLAVLTDRSCFSSFPSKISPTFAKTLESYIANPTLVAARIQNLPIGDVQIPTPIAKFDPKNKKDFTSEGVLIALGLHLGYPYSYKNESDGDVVQNIFPVQSLANLQSSKGSVELTAHTELSCTKEPPDLLLLLCLKKGRSGAQAYTGIISLEDAVKILPLHHQKMLGKPVYRTEIDPSMRLNDQDAIHTAAFPIIRQNDGVREYTYDVDFTKTDDIEGNAALTALREVYQAVEQKVILEPGDALIIKNRLAAHTRGAFSPRYDGTDRWLQRMIVSHKPRGFALTTIA